MKNAVTESLVRYLKNNLPHFPTAEADFIKDYYHRLSGQDYNHHIAIELYELALQHRKMANTKRRTESKFKIQNIAPSKDNSFSKTIILIVLDNRPFLINSLLMRLNEQNKTPLRMLHPNFDVVRNSKNQIVEIGRNAQNDSTLSESYIQLLIPFTPTTEHDEIIHSLQGVLDEVNDVVDDYQPMQDIVTAHAESLRQFSNTEKLTRYAELLLWMTQHNFAFLGYCEVIFNIENNSIRLDKDSLLGCVKTQKAKKTNLIKEVLAPVKLSKTSPFIFTKTRCRSQVHRNSHMDCIVFNHDFEESKKEVRLSYIIGFLGGSTLHLPLKMIPYLSDKAHYILRQSTLRSGGYAYKELRDILETLPRSLLFQMDRKSLYGLSMTLLNQRKRKTRLHVSQNVCGHFYSCLVYVPRDLFDSNLRKEITMFLQQFFNAREIDFEVYFPSEILARIHHVIYTNDATNIDYKTHQLEKAVQQIALDWDSGLSEICSQHYGQEKSIEIVKQFNKSFPADYRYEYSIEKAFDDISLWLNLNEGQVDSRVVPSKSSNASHANFKVYGNEVNITLSDILPIFENMGMRVFREQPYEICTNDKQAFYLLDFKVKRKDGKAFDFTYDAALLQECFIRCWYGEAENDGFNQLVLLSRLTWREVSLIRAYFRYLKQIRLRYSEQYIIEALCAYPELVKTIFCYFQSIFSVTENRQGMRRLKRQIATHLEQVATLDEERIITALMDVVNATLRTNFFQLNTQRENKSYISLKLKSDAIPRIPQPAPQYEIFVYSPKMEGVHLRSGKIARGGLRWSDRTEDFRTEVLGLVKAQQVKNSLIVPHGSKGGFVIKQPIVNGSREALWQQGIDCYKTYIRGLLDITDNLAGNKVIRPDNVVALDEDDPYLVVAADKGTATFSDYANAISEQYNFWLADAFASGGSAGYDHKKMGITARGAWESVKRHFREQNKDIQAEVFSVAAIGDMSGDVFGNGMLLSKQIKLVAAFNHTHIFIDPNPDIARSYRERKRLFALPRSTWNDYNSALISKGGGVFSRTDKAIHLSAQARKLLQANKDKYTPNELIRLILKAPVELLWNGGIGTYVKAATETQSDAQDRNNDEVRVNADELQCQVIGEGGNLGLTQLARIEYSQLGGKCYNDAIDNSAGVDTSDHEVNIKILLNSEVKNNKLSITKRNRLLDLMEEEVADLVLMNNYQQTQTISIEATFSDELMPQQIRALHTLETQSLLNRQIEFLDSHKKLKERQHSKQFLTRPELAVLLSYSKLDLHKKLLDSTLPESSFCESTLLNYFPQRLHKTYKKQILNHPLKREIIATMVTNELVNIMGPCFCLNIHSLTKSRMEDIVRCFIATIEILDIRQIVSAIKQLNNKVSAQAQMFYLKQIRSVIQLTVIQLLSTSSTINIGHLIKQYQKPYKNLISCYKQSDPTVVARAHKLRQKMTKQKIPKSVADRLVTLLLFSDSFDIIYNANKHQIKVVDSAWCYLKANEALKTDWLLQQISALDNDSIWNEKMRSGLSHDLRQKVLSIAAKIMATNGKTIIQKFNFWQQENQHQINNFIQSVTTAQSDEAIEPIVLSVLVDELNKLI